MLESEKRKKKEILLQQKMLEQQDPVVSSVHDRLRSVLMGKTKSEHSILFDPKKAAEAVTTLEDWHMSGSEGSGKVTKRAKSGIPNETAEEKVDKMLTLNLIQATDV